MKLLSKSQVTIQVAKERKTQIDEGVTLARKVDTLRETLTNLEQQHTQFIAGMERALNDKTTHLIEQVAILERELVTLKQKKADILTPFGGEIEKAIHSQQEFNDMKSELEKVKSEVVLKEEKLVKLGTDIKVRLGKIKVRERELERAYSKAKEYEDEQKRKVEETTSLQITQEKNFKEREEKLHAREDIIASYEFTLRTRNEQIELAEEANLREKAQLLDQRATLERAFARINK